MHNGIQWLPNLISYSKENHDTYKIYFQILYSVFRNDFIVNRVKFQNNFNVAVDKKIGEDGLEEIFYHVTCGGNLEVPDLNRCERVAWNKSIIENSGDNLVKLWKNKRGRKINFCLFLEQENFLIVLLDLKSHVKLVTAYYIEQEERKGDLIKECEEYLSNPTL